MTAMLPNMNPDLAAGIYDWRTTGETPSAGGAKSAYYLALPTPYNCKNSAFETVDELLMVKDITPSILYGNDSNRNGILDATDVDPASSASGLNSSSSVTLGGIQHGLTDYVTVYSTEPATDSNGQTRVNVNGGTAGAGGAGGGANGNANNNLLTVLTTYLSGSRVAPVLAASIAGRPFRNVLDYYYRTGLTQDEFNLLADHLTTGGTPRGLININTASQAVLTTLPGLSASDVASIYALRQNGTGATSIAAVATILTRAKGTSIGGMITTRSYRCSADIVAVDGTGRSFKRYQVVFDTIANPAKILYIRDITSLGWPLDPNILAQLRSGQSISGTITSSSSLGGTH
jgi:DNA uptake protein ComE-like DNA-binding protein